MSAADAKSLAGSLDSLDDADNYRRWILELGAPALGRKVLEVGAGIGTFTPDLAAHGEVVALEPDAQFAGLLRTAVSGHPNVSVVEAVVADLPVDQAFDGAVMINVLEHIEDDSAVLQQIRERLAPGGRLFIWVPAFELLMSPFDRSIGHHRRYRRRPLVDLVEQAGYQVESSRYVNLPGWFSWLLFARVLRRPPTSGGLVRVFDRFVVPVVRAVERRVRPPFGQSIALVAVRRER